MSRRLRISRRPGGRAIGCAAIASIALGLLAGCQTPLSPAPAAPAPAIQLLDAARLDLPAGCTVTAGRTYRMSYTVGLDGRTGSLGAITPPDAPACLQAALASWVATFRYAPLTQTESVTADWILVTARRGS